jgi:hypothetical protein
MPFTEEREALNVIAKKERVVSIMTDEINDETDFDCNTFLHIFSITNGMINGIMGKLFSATTLGRPQ